MDELIEVELKYFAEGEVKDPDDGAPCPAGWYLWEKEYPEEGCFWVGEARPDAAGLKAICENYVEVQASTK